jgi:outer membrane protein assembly factor BamB
LAGPHLYAGLLEGAVLQLDAETGARSWAVRVAGSVRVAPVPVPGGVIVATDTDTLYRLDAGSGAVRARAGTPGTVLAAPALTDSLLIVGTTAGTLAGYDARTLERRWEVGRGAAIVGAVAVQAGTAWAVGADGTLLTVPLDQPTAYRTTPTGLTARAGPTPAEGGALLAGVDGWIARYDASLARSWLARLQGPITHALVLDDGEAIAVTQNGRVAVFR